ncbi:MAG: DNA alkylation response protein [Xanthobacteraceae bacterium]|nr:MAG: DNA alkylation response protein [Xanthobacteraceae bacterium]
MPSGLDAREASAGPEPLSTHEVFNQPPPFEDVDLFALDAPLGETVKANGAGAAAAELAAFGRSWGTAAMFERGRLANRHAPELATFDARGFRRDTVEFHPAYHDLMTASMAASLHNATWTKEGARAPAPAEVVRAAKFYMAAQVETGHLCPITMTRAAVAALGAEPAVLGALMPKLSSTTYDPAFWPIGAKRSITLGMGMTEKQGGTDVRANTTAARRDGAAYRITGHKWFMSAPMCDAFLVLAQAGAGLTCFLMPRFAPDGSVNGLRFQRLKDKLGNRSNASAEVEFAEAYALRVGEEGRGVRTIIEMVQLTRLDCAIASAGLMRMALAQALHHARHRSVFQKRLSDHPLMRAVLADLALTAEGAVAVVMRLARAFDHAAADRGEAARMRLLTPAIKCWVCKGAPAFAYEAMECMGGNGYVEDSLMARLYREAPVNAIWEGSGNVMCLDVLRAMMKDADAAQALLRELTGEAHGLPGVEAAAARLAGLLRRPDAEAVSRLAVEHLALIAVAAALNGISPASAELFARTRLAGPRGASFGAQDVEAAGVELLLTRALPSF